MNFSSLFPVVDFTDKYDFESVENLSDFLKEIIRIYRTDSEQRIKESCLSVYMAFRDHYPSYMAALDPGTKKELDVALLSANPKILKLRRIVIRQLSKVA